MYNSELGENYGGGPGQRLKDMWAEVTSKLRDLIRPVNTGNDEIPPGLANLLQMNVVRNPVPEPAKFEKPSTTFQDDRWTVEGKIRVFQAARQKTLGASPHIDVTPESGKHLTVKWDTFDVEKGDAEYDSDSDWPLTIKPGNTWIRFKGTASSKSSTLDFSRCRIDIRCPFTELSEPNT